MRWTHASLALLVASGCYASHGRDVADGGGAPVDAWRPSSCVEGVRCDDGDPCTSGDRCRAGACAGVARACATPPGRCFAANGACVGGECVYEGLGPGVACDDGDPCTTGDACMSGTCAGEALRCDAPPAPVCVGAGTRRTFAGACEAGACRYDPVDAACPSGCVDGACCEPWTTVDVDPGPPFVGGPGPRGIAVDAAGGVHVVYRREAGGTEADWVMYAHRPAGGAWSVESIGRGRGLAVMGVGPAGTVHAFYVHADDGRLVHAMRPPGAGWIVADVPSDEPLIPSSGTVPVQMVVDAEGGLHISSGGRAPTYGHRTPSGVWTFSWPFGEARPVAMARGPDGEPHVLYADGAGTWHGHRPPGGPWSFELLETERIAGNFLIDALGGMHFLSAHPTAAGLSVGHAYRAADGTWTTTETVEAIGTVAFANLSAAIDGRGALHVAYVAAPEGSDNRIGYARRAPSGTWSAETIDAENDRFLQPWVAVAADDGGGAHLAFGDHPLPLRYAYKHTCPPPEP